jgi:hypothetical protein
MPPVRQLHTLSAFPGDTEAYFGFTEGEQEFLIKSKLEQGIAHLDEKLRGFLPPLQDILSLKVENKEYLKLEPQKKRERIFEAIRDLLIRESQDRPLILAVEDLQWIDKTSEEFLDYFIGFLASSHILLVLLYRPEYTHLWGSRSYYSQIRVEQLPISASAELVQSILEGGEVVAEYNRDGLFVTSKLLPTHFRYSQMKKAAERSLKRLGLKYFDMYLIHFPNSDIPMKKL